MKKLLLLSAVMLVARFVSAQKIDFGARLRFTDANLKIVANNGLTREDRGLANIDAGVFADIKYRNFALQPGLLLALKGGGYGGILLNTTTGYSETYTDLHLHTLELPMNLLYNMHLKAGKIFIGGGPYVAYALSGSYKNYTTQYSSSNSGSINTTSSAPVKFGSGTTNINRVDFGFNGLAGFRLNNGIEINLGMGFGLANVINNSNVTMHHRTLSAGIGYFFM